jgi:ligand-binding SRPBCC domain-containing protein
MKIYTLNREQVVPRPLDDVFPFFADPRNLVRLTPSSLGFIILTPPPIEMRQGALIDYTIGILGIRTHWRTLISDYDPPHSFTDVQLKGPYPFWHHTHSFRQVQGGTVIGDEVRYVLPFGIIGRAVHALLVERQLREIFDFRERVTAEIFAGGSMTLSAELRRSE